jgi:hypothetical protein
VANRFLFQKDPGYREETDGSEIPISKKRQEQVQQLEQEQRKRELQEAREREQQEKKRREQFAAYNWLMNKPPEIHRNEATIGKDMEDVDRQIEAQKKAERIARDAAKPLQEKLPAYVTGEQSKAPYGSAYAPGIQAQEQPIPAKTVSPEVQRLQEKRQWLESELYQSKSHYYDSFTKASDFKENSVYVPTERDADTDSGWEDPLYEYINGNQEAGEYLRRQDEHFGEHYSDGERLFDIVMGTTTKGNEESYWMTQKDISIYNYLFHTRGKQAANDYYDFIQSDLYRRQREAVAELWTTTADEHPVLTSTYSVLTSPAKGLSYVGQVKDYLDDGEIDQNAPYNGFVNVNNAIRTQVTEKIEKNWGKVGSFAYNTGMGMLDFLYASALTANTPGITLTIMGSGAAADKVVEAKDRGLSDDQAFALGTITGIVEAAVESMNMDTVFDLKFLKESTLKYMLKNGMAEGKEEVIAETVNLIADICISKDKSHWQASIDYYKSQGNSESEAVAKAFGDQALNMVMAYGGGFLSGSLLSGGTTLIAKNQYRDLHSAEDGKFQGAQDINVPGNAPEQEEIDWLTNGLYQLQQEDTQTEQAAPEKIAEYSEETIRDAMAETVGAPVQKNTAQQGGEAVRPSIERSPTYEELTQKNDLPVINIGVNSEGKNYAQMKEDARQKAVAEKWFDEPHTNADTGLPIFLTEKTFTHAFSNLTKDFGTDTILAMNHLPELVRSAVLTNASDPKNPNKPETKVYTFLAAIKGENGIEPVKLTVKEYESVSTSPLPKNILDYFRRNRTTRTNNRLYDVKALEVIGVERAEAEKEFGASAIVAERPGRSVANSTPNSTIKVADLMGLVKGDAEKYIPKQQNGDRGVPEGFEAMGAASRGFSPKYALIDKYGNLPEGENPTRADQLPASVTGKDRVSLTARTALEAEATTDEFAELIENKTVQGGFSYIPITNSETVQRAVTEISEAGWERSRGAWEQQVRNGQVSADIIATGALLYNHAVNSGDYTAAMDILMDYSQAARNAGQAVQAARILKTLTPENRLYMIRRSVHRMVEDMGLDREIAIDENLARQYQQAYDPDEADHILDLIARDVARQIPSTSAERFTALRYLNMLGNFRTQVRNLVGNLANKGLYLVKDELAATVEGLASLASGGKFQKSKVHFTDRATRQAAKADYENVADWISGGGRTHDRADTSTDFARRVQAKRQIFRFAPAEWYRKGTDWAMNNRFFGDAAFGRTNYARALAGYLNARGIKTDNLDTVDPEILNAGREYAVRQAQEATFRDNNQVSTFVSQVLRGKNTPGWARVIGEAVMPFRKTPANVLVRAEEFSPLGLINSAVNTVQAARGNISGAELVDSWAKTITGTGLFAIGWALANMGFLRGGPDEDEDKAAFDKMNGLQDYAIQLPDGTNLTIDAFTPTALPLLLGAQMDKVLDGSDMTWADLEGMLSTLADPMIEMSMLSGLNDTIDAIRYADNSLGQFLVNASFNYLAQALGNTLLGQLERSTEESRMTTYIDKDSPVPAWLQRNLGKLSQKIPGIDYQQTPYIDQWGREQKNPEGIKNWLYNLLSPSYIDKAEVDAVAEELYRLNEVQSDVNVFPQSPETTISYTDSDGNRHEKYNLTSEESDRLKRAEGKTQAKLVADLIGGEDYAALTDAQKAEAVKLCYDYARELARGEVLPGYDGMSSWMEGIEGSEATAIIAKVAGGELSGAMSALVTNWREGYDDDTGALEELEQAAEAYSNLTPGMQETIREGMSGRTAAYLDARAAGVDTETFSALYRKYWEIDQSEAGASEKAGKWAYELEKAMERREISQEQKNILKSSLRFFQNFPAETEKFDQLTGNGLSADHANDIGWMLKGLEVQEGYTQVRDIQKAEAIGGMEGLSEADRIAALKIYGTNAQDENLDLMLEMGYSSRDYLTAWKIYSQERETGGKGTKNRTIEAFMQKFDVDRATAAAIYDIYG